MSCWARWVGFSNHINPAFFSSTTDWVTWWSSSTSSCTVSARTRRISFCYNVDPTGSWSFTHNWIWRAGSRLDIVSGRTWGVGSCNDIHPTLSRRLSHCRTSWTTLKLGSILCRAWRVSFGDSVDPRASSSLTKGSRSSDMIKLTHQNIAVRWLSAWVNGRSNIQIRLHQQSLGRAEI